MATREWTGSVNVLPEALRHLAAEFFERTYEDADGTAREDSELTDGPQATDELRALRQWLRDHASTLSEWADAVEQLYVRVSPPEGDTPTAAQGVALARVMRDHGAARAVVATNPFGLPDGYIGFDLFRSRAGEQAANSLDQLSLVGGIDRDGRVST